jgi:hypothetical protein
MTVTLRSAILLLAGGLALLNLGGCNGQSSASSGATPAPSPVVNTAPLVSGTSPSGNPVINLLYVTVTLCAPGSTTLCQTIDHVQVDTGSTGLRILASALGAGLNSAQLPQVADSAGRAVVECAQFADGFSWGPVKQVDLTIAGEVAHSLTIQIIGDPAYESAIPQACTSPVDVEEDSAEAFGANGILGVGNFLQDCGEACAQGAQSGANYNVCSASSGACVPYTIAVDDQVRNPVALFATDNNGVLIKMPLVADSGAADVAGSLIFGINTQSDNTLGLAKVYQLQPNGTFTTTLADSVAMATLTDSFIDSGSNGYFFPSSIPECVNAAYFYCPSSTVELTATITGENGATSLVNFSVGSAYALTDAITTYPLLGGPGVFNGTSFDWGLPFFLGRPVFVALESTSLNGVTGPSVAF